MTYIILNWNNITDMAIVTNGYGTPMIFDTIGEAKTYANTELNFQWKIVEVHG